MTAGAALSSPSLAFARHVRLGLGRASGKKLSPEYLYDASGSALFETITLLPEYGLTAADERLIRDHSAAIVDRFRSPVLVAELGSGTGRKTRWLLETLARRQLVSYYPIDISEAALTRCEYELAGAAGLTISPLPCSYLDGLSRIAARRKPSEKLLVLFLGSTIGNFDRPDAVSFLGQVRRHLQRGDGLLLGCDLVKPAADLLLAYDDPTRVTAAFNLNLLARINRELGGEFDLRAFRHLTRYNQRERRVEMHLRSLQRQRVPVRGAGFTATFAGGETIWTESSYKYTPGEIGAMAAACGFSQAAQWVDAQWPFAESLWIAAP